MHASTPDVIVTYLQCLESQHVCTSKHAVPNRTQSFHPTCTDL